MLFPIAFVNLHIWKVFLNGLFEVSPRPKTDQKFTAISQHHAEVGRKWPKLHQKSNDLGNNLYDSKGIEPPHAQIDSKKCTPIMSKHIDAGRDHQNTSNQTTGIEKRKNIQ